MIPDYEEEPLTRIYLNRFNIPTTSLLSKCTSSLMCWSNNINLCLPRAAREDILGFMHTHASSLG